jgi:NADH:ubiquinone oxidoreductase subunit K
MLIAAAETVVALAIILNAFHFFMSNQLESYKTLGEK